MLQKIRIFVAACIAPTLAVAICIVALVGIALYRKHSVGAIVLFFLGALLYTFISCLPATLTVPIYRFLAFAGKGNPT